jgi:hypothetical protein
MDNYSTFAENFGRHTLVLPARFAKVSARSSSDNLARAVAAARATSRGTLGGRDALNRFT